MKIGIVGSGISGLTTAFYLSRAHKAKVTLFGALGGWIQSHFLGNCLVESGPRTLRPGGLVGLPTLELIHCLGLKPLCVSKQAPPSLNRFIILDGALVKLSPLSILSVRKLRKAFVTGLLTDTFASKGELRDESVESFVSRRMGKEMVNDVVSAVFHGIYAGNVSQLSIRATMPFLWDAEQRSGSLLKHFLFTKYPSFETTLDGWLNEPHCINNVDSFREFSTTMNRDFSMYTFQGGLQTLVTTLFQDLCKRPNFEYVPTSCQSISSGSNDVSLTLENGQKWKGDHVVAAIPSHSLANLLSHSTLNRDLKNSSVVNTLKLARELKEIPSVNVIVVNLVFKNSTLPVDGFGYLVPKSELDNSKGVLGVIFDSCVLSHVTPSQPSDDYVKVTVMMGGHAFPRYFGPPESLLPDSPLIMNTAMESVKILGLIQPNLIHSKVSIHQNCISEYSVGHLDRLDRIDSLLKDIKRLSIVGSSYRGVGINDCISNARKLAMTLNSQ